LSGEFIGPAVLLDGPLIGLVRIPGVQVLVRRPIAVLVRRSDRLKLRPQGIVGDKSRHDRHFAGDEGGDEIFYAGFDDLPWGRQRRPSPPGGEQHTDMSIEARLINLKNAMLFSAAREKITNPPD
jgi:hypothetical protein